jgi:hypothetical protein
LQPILGGQVGEQIQDISVSSATSQFAKRIVVGIDFIIYNFKSCVYTRIKFKTSLSDWSESPRLATFSVCTDQACWMAAERIQRHPRDGEVS